MFFGYYEGFRNDQGITTSATVPTAAGSGRAISPDLGVPLINFAAGGVPIPGQQDSGGGDQSGRAQRRSTCTRSATCRRPSIARRWSAGTISDQAGGRIDVNASSSDQFFARYSYSGGYNINPISVRGTDVPGFPTRDDLATHSAALSENHIFSPSMINSLRGSYLRHKFFFDQRLNQTPPSALGFGYTSSNAEGQGPPFFNVSGYSPIGGAITGPRNSTQNMFELQDALSWTRGAHLVKFGGGYQHTAIDMFQAIAPNAFYVFAGTFPTNNAVANLLLGAPVTFYQGLGDFGRDIRVWGASAYAQDEWRVGRRLTLNYGLRYERINPITEAQNRLTGFIPGVQSVVFPTRPSAWCSRATRASRTASRRAPTASCRASGSRGIRPAPACGRSGPATACSTTSSRTAPGTASQVPVSSIPWAQFNQFSGAGLNFQNPYLGHALSGAEHLRASVDRVHDRHGAKPPYTQDWNVERRSDRCSTSTCSRSATSARRAARLPRNIEDNPAVYGPGATAQNADRRRVYANCPADGGTCDFSTIAMLSYITHSNYEAGQVSLSRRYAGRRRLQRLVLALEHEGRAVVDESVGRGGEAARGRERSGAEPVRRRRRVRAVAVRRAPPVRRQRELGAARAGQRARRVRAIFGGWQLNGIATLNSGTPFTVSDSANVSLQANSPPISGFAASRPNLVGDPNAGPHTVDEWMSRSAFQRLEPCHAGRPVRQRGPQHRARPRLRRPRRVARCATSSSAPATRLELRAESFNVTNHVNFGLPVADLNSANFGRILSAGPPRLMQFGVKLIF